MVRGRVTFEGRCQAHGCSWATAASGAALPRVKRTDAIGSHVQRLRATPSPWDIKQGRGRRTSAATAGSFLAARTRLSERGPCFAQNFLAAGVSTVREVGA